MGSMSADKLDRVLSNFDKLLAKADSHRIVEKVRGRLGDRVSSRIQGQGVLRSPGSVTGAAPSTTGEVRHISPSASGLGPESTRLGSGPLRSALVDLVTGRGESSKLDAEIKRLDVESRRRALVPKPPELPTEKPKVDNSKEACIP